MTKLTILTSSEKRRFESPPFFTQDYRLLYFALSKHEMKIVEEIRTSTNKVGFLLQLGYFKAHAKFFSTSLFYPPDIEYVTKTLGFSPDSIDISSYQKKIPTDHRKRILKLLGWQAFDKDQQTKVAEYIHWLAQRQLAPRNIFFSIVDYCWQNKIELPTYNNLITSIAQGYTHFETQTSHVITNKLNSTHCQKLDEFTHTNNKSNKLSKQMQRSPLGLIKQINQSLQPQDIQENIKAFKVFQAYFINRKTLG